MKNWRLVTFILTVILLTPGSLLFSQNVGEPGREKVGPNPLKNVYFGEQHMHTANSFDAFTVGVNASWEEAYRLARG